MMGYDSDHEEWKEKEHEQRVGEEREGLEEAARQEGLSLSSYVRRLLTIRRGARLRGRTKAQGDESGPPSSGKGK